MDPSCFKVFIAYYLVLYCWLAHGSDCRSILPVFPVQKVWMKCHTHWFNVTFRPSSVIIDSIFSTFMSFIFALMVHISTLRCKAQTAYSHGPRYLEGSGIAFASDVCGSYCDCMESIGLHRVHRATVSWHVYTSATISIPSTGKQAHSVPSRPRCPDTSFILWIGM